MRSIEIKALAERGAIAAKAGSLLRERIDEFSRSVTLEMGELIAEARGEVELTADVIDYYAKNVERFLAPEPYVHTGRPIHSYRVQLQNENKTFVTTHGSVSAIFLLS